MKKRAIFLGAVSSVLFSKVALGDIIVEEPPMVNNLGPLASASDGSTSVDIVNSEEASGQKEGEITLKYNSGVGVEVYSGLAKVEHIPVGSDGWTGSFKVERGVIFYTPAGRPQLECRAQSLAGWYGPCKIKEAD